MKDIYAESDPGVEMKGPNDPVTRADKEQILGLNFARMMGVDVEAKKRELAALPVTV